MTRYAAVMLLACFGFLGLTGGPILAGEAEATAEPLTSEMLDRMILERIDGLEQFQTVGDEQFLRRVSLDLIGRQATPDEVEAFLADGSADKRTKAIERLLAHDEFGRSWANYWSDVISFRTPPPELTFLDYGPFEEWLAGQLNANTPWDQIVRAMFTATGKVKDSPQVTFIAYHEGNPVRLAAETARIFMGVQIGCAQCHDHPFDDWKREQFHHLAAYFARTKVKMPWNEGPETEVSDNGKGEYLMPDAMDPTKKGAEMVPVFLTGTQYEKGKSDVERRTALAELLVAPENNWFVDSYVNRVWARLMGRGFCEPVDDLSGGAHLLSNVYEALTAEFRRSGFDTKALLRLVLNTRAYQQTLSSDPELAEKPFAAARAGRLRGDEVFDSLVTAIELPNVTPKKTAPTAEIRFPPPPKSTRTLIAEAFGFDPSLSPWNVSRTLNQAMLMMNNDQLQAQIDAKPGAGTVLSRLLEAEPDNGKALERLFLVVLARKPTEKESTIGMEHIQTAGSRESAFEDLLWSLINSTEFTTKR